MNENLTFNSLPPKVALVRAVVSSIIRYLGIRVSCGCLVHKRVAENGAVSCLVLHRTVVKVQARIPFNLIDAFY